MRRHSLQYLGESVLRDEKANCQTKSLEISPTEIKMLKQKYEDTCQNNKKERKN